MLHNVFMYWIFDIPTLQAPSLIGTAQMEVVELKGKGLGSPQLLTVSALSLCYLVILINFLSLRQYVQLCLDIRPVLWHILDVYEIIRKPNYLKQGHSKNHRC